MGLGCLRWAHDIFRIIPLVMHFHETPDVDYVSVISGLPIGQFRYLIRLEKAVRYRCRRFYLGVIKELLIEQPRGKGVELFVTYACGEVCVYRCLPLDVLGQIE